MGRITWIVVVFILSCAAQPRAPTAAPQGGAPSRAQLLDTARAVAHTWMRAHPPEALHFRWGEGVLAYGLWQLYRESRDAQLRTYLVRYLTSHQARGIRVSWSDHTTPAISAAELVLDGELSVRPALDQVVSYLMSAPRTEAQGLIRHLGRRVPSWLTPRGLFPDIWVDSLFHMTITLCRYSRVRGDAQYRDLAAAQLVGFLRNLQDPETGLVTHAYNDRPRDEAVPPFAARAFWARGNGWALVSAAEVWHELPDAHPLRAEIAARARRLAAALTARAHADSGLYHTLVLDAGSYLETAGSALIVYGLAHGARSGLFGAREAHAARHGMRGLLGALEDRAGGLEVSGTSLGTNPRARRYARIAQRNQVSYGVGAFLLAASALVAAEPRSPGPPSPSAALGSGAPGALLTGR